MKSICLPLFQGGISENYSPIGVSSVGEAIGSAGVSVGGVIGSVGISGVSVGGAIGSTGGVVVGSSIIEN